MHRASGVGVVPCSLLLVHGVGVVPTVGSVHCAGVSARCVRFVHRARGAEFCQQCWCWRWCIEFGDGVCARCLRFVHRASGVGVVPCSLLLVHGVGVVPTVWSVLVHGVGAGASNLVLVFVHDA